MTIAYEVLARVYEHYQQYEQAFYFYKKYTRANQIKLDQINAKILAIQNAKLNVIEKNTQINLLVKENALLRTQSLRHNKLAQNRSLALGLLIMALLVFVLWAYRK